MQFDLQYHSAIDGQGAVVQLADAVAYLDADTLFAPLDSGQGVTPHLTVENGISTQRFNMVRMDITIYYGRLWRGTQTCSSKNLLTQIHEMQ